MWNTVHLSQRLASGLPGYRIVAVFNGLLPGRRALQLALTRLVLFSYALFLIKPVMPLLVDKAAHSFWKNVHIAVVHHENGKDHLHYELIAAGKDLAKDVTGAKVKLADNALHLFEKIDFTPTGRIPLYSTVLFARLASMLLESSLPLDAPPPER